LTIYSLSSIALAAAKAKKPQSHKAQERAVAEYQKVSQWTTADTALPREVETFELGKDFLALGFIFTLKFDSDGNWKIVKTQSMSKEEAMNE
jgi:hypothetical protein